MSTEPVLEIKGLSHRYKGGGGISDVSLSVRPGERLALLGHNGAGKSTLMRTVLGLLQASAGQVLIAGHAPQTAAARAATAYLPESVAFHPAITGREQLALFARLGNVPLARCAELLSKVGLAEAADRRIGTYSKGMRQRLGMAQVFLGQPKVALLDEPTSGLDPMARHDLYALVDALADEGTAVVMASHALTEIEARTDRVAILRQGQMVANDTLAALAERANLPILFRVRAAQDATALFAQFGGRRINGAKVEFSCAAHQKMARLAQITALGADVADVEMLPPSIEDLYRYYGATQGSEKL